MAHPSCSPARNSLLLLLLALLLAACSDADGPNAPVGPEVPVADPARGAVAFADACASCHTARDAFDLARFGFADSTILRRAVAHVDTATARDIIAHVRSLGVSPVDDDLPLFQPTGTRADDDVSLALALFGGDAWPASWGETEVLGVDPTGTALAVDFPVWSDEGSGTDWMPDMPLPLELAQDRGGLVQGALVAYDAEPSEENLVRALRALKLVIHDPASPLAPCAQEEDGALADPEVCFQTSRWTATLAGQHLIRYGLTFDGEVAGRTTAQDAFWDVGQAARRSLVRNRDPVADAERNWVSWMMLGWVFAPQNRASVYHITGLNRVGLPRHGTLVTVRSLAARRPGSPQPYTDLRVLTTFGHRPWLAGATATAVTILETREERGEVPQDPGVRADVAGELARAVEVLERRLGRDVAAPLAERIRGLSAYGG